jgi:hypothetical protein
MIGGHGHPGQVPPTGAGVTGREALTVLSYLRYLVDFVRYFIRSPWAPARVASAIVDLLALGLASLVIFLVFGGPLAWAVHTVALARIAGMGH